MGTTRTGASQNDTVLVLKRVSSDREKKHIISSEEIIISECFSDDVTRSYADSGQHASRRDAEVDVADVVGVRFSERFRQLPLRDVVAVDEKRPRAHVQDRARFLKK